MSIIGAKPQNDRPEVEPPREIQTIFDRCHFARETHGAQDRYVRETRVRPLTNVNNLDKRPAKHFKGGNDNITFRDSDAHLVHYPYCDALALL